MCIGEKWRWWNIEWCMIRGGSKAVWQKRGVALVSLKGLVVVFECGSETVYTATHTAVSDTSLVLVIGSITTPAITASLELRHYSATNS